MREGKNQNPILLNRIPEVMRRKRISSCSLEMATFYPKKQLRALIGSRRYLLNRDQEAVFCRIMDCRPEELYCEVERIPVRDLLKDMLRIYR